MQIFERGGKPTTGIVFVLENGTIHDGVSEDGDDDGIAGAVCGGRRRLRWVG